MDNYKSPKYEIKQILQGIVYLHKEEKSSHSYLSSWFNYNVFSCKYGILDGKLALIGEQKCVASLSQLKALLVDTCRKDAVLRENI